MQPLILIIEDDERMAQLIRRGLEESGYDVTLATDGAEGLAIALAKRFDVVITDILLPSQSGLEVCKTLKREDEKYPIIMLTALGTTDDKIDGFDAGADDYMVKPFEIVELLARVNIVLRRYNKMEQQLTFKDIAIDTKNQNVSKAGKHIELTPKEFELLELLMRNKNITLFREKIYEEIWGSEYSVESRTLDLHIQRLRKKLDIGDSLKTVFKAGYRLEE